MHHRTDLDFARRLTLVGLALRYCLRFITPATSFFFLLAVAFRLGAAQWIPEPTPTTTLFLSWRDVVIAEAANFASALGAVSALACMAAALTTLDDRQRAERPLWRHMVVALVAMLGGVCLVPAFRY